MKDFSLICSIMGRALLHQSAVMVPPRHVITSYTSGSARLVISTSCTDQHDDLITTHAAAAEGPDNQHYLRSRINLIRRHKLRLLSHARAASAVFGRFVWSSKSSLVCVDTYECNDAEAVM